MLKNVCLQKVRAELCFILKITIGNNTKRSLHIKYFFKIYYKTRKFDSLRNLKDVIMTLNATRAGLVCSLK